MSLLAILIGILQFYSQSMRKNPLFCTSEVFGLVSLKRWEPLSSVGVIVSMVGS